MKKVDITAYLDVLQVLLNMFHRDHHPNSYDFAQYLHVGHFFLGKAEQNVQFLMHARSIYSPDIEPSLPERLIQRSSVSGISTKKIRQLEVHDTLVIERKRGEIYSLKITR
jgi:hypothetical protein